MLQRNRRVREWNGMLRGEPSLWHFMLRCGYGVCDRWFGNLVLCAILHDERSVPVRKPLLRPAVDWRRSLHCERDGPTMPLRQQRCMHDRRMRYV